MSTADSLLCQPRPMRSDGKVRHRPSEYAPQVLDAVLPSLGPMHRESKQFWAALAVIASRSPRAGPIAVQLGMRTSTLFSRFARAGLPSPAKLLLGFRWCVMARMLDDGDRPIWDIALSMGWSSGAAMGRAMRSAIGMSPNVFRDTRPFNDQVRRYLESLQPTVSRWKTFRPITGSGTVKSPDRLAVMPCCTRCGSVLPTTAVAVLTREAANVR